MASHEELSDLPELGPGKTPSGRARLPSSRPREKPQLSCNLCRRRKQRCDRQHPCTSCTQRGLGASCTYASGTPRPPSDAAPRAPAAPTTIQDRIRHLESLLVDLMQQTSGSPASHSQSANPHQHGGFSSPSSPIHAADPSPIATPSEELSGAASPTPPADYGSMYLEGSSARYVSSAHWAAVLDGIAELKDHFDNEEAAHPDRTPSDLPSVESTGPQLLYGGVKAATKEEILASIPARPVVDRLVSRYFNSFEMSPAVLHSAQFLKEYEEFWQNPSATPVIWLGLLFTIMCLATQLQKFRLDPGIQTAATASMEQDLVKMVESFRLKIVQCLTLGKYVKGGPYVLETLLLYVACELFLSKDTEIGVWILMGTIVQLAMHMGYHRDPRHFSTMSPFAAEMRRRVWATVVELDLGIAAQMGLPRLIKQWQTDTREPSNLQDSDFSKATTLMPPPRPETDLTPILYRLVKARLMTTIGYIWDFAADVRTYTYAEAMKMDARLEEAHKVIPDCLRWQSIANCITDSPQIIMQKVFLETLFDRAKIILHRRYLFQPSNKHGDSRQVCLAAALRLLDYQQMLQEETQPFCQLYQERWRVSSLMNHNFLLATSILCYYLQQARAEASQESETAMEETILASLRRSYDTWLLSSTTSREAMKATRALNVILGVRNDSAADSGIGTNTSFGMPSPYACSNASSYVQGNASGFGIQFPVFDATLMSNWATPDNEMVGSFPSSGSATNAGWQTMDDVMGAGDSLAWPWNLQ